MLQIEDTVEFEGYRPVLTEYLARVGAVMVAPLQEIAAEDVIRV